jgi:hypothetical protein
METYNYGGLEKFRDVFFLFDREYSNLNPVFEYSVSYLAILFVCFILLILIFKYKSMIFEVLVSTLLIALITLGIDYRFTNARTGFYLLLGSILLNLAVLICKINFPEKDDKASSNETKTVIVNKSRLIRHLTALYLFSALPIIIIVKDVQNAAKVSLFFFSNSADYYEMTFMPPLGTPILSGLGANLYNSIGMNAVPIIEIIIVVMIFLLLLERWQFNFKNIKIDVKYIFGVLVVLFIIFTVIFHRHERSGNFVFLKSLVSPILTYLLCPWILLPYFLVIDDEREHNIQHLGFIFFLLQNCMIIPLLTLSNTLLIGLREFHILDGHAVQFTLNLLVLPFIASKIYLNRKKEQEIPDSVLG